MRTREATYTDYGFKKGEEKQLKQYCLDLELPDKLLLLQCAHECNPMVEDDLFYSISKGVAFQVLARKGIDQNYKCHADVYGYKRKTLALFRSALQACGRYPFQQQNGKLGENITVLQGYGPIYDTHEWTMKREESALRWKMMAFCHLWSKSNEIFTHVC